MARILAALPLLAFLALAAHAWGHTGHALTADISMKLVSETTKAHLRALLPAHLHGNLALVASWADEVKRTPRFSHTGPLHYSDAHDDPPLTCSYIFARDCPDGNCVTAAIKQFAAILAEYRDTHPEPPASVADVVELGDAYDTEDEDEEEAELHPRHIEAASRRRRHRQRRPPKGRRPGRRPPRRAPGNGRKSRRPRPPAKSPPRTPPTAPPGQSPIQYTPEEALKFLVHLIQDVHQPMHLTGKLRGGNDQPAQFGRSHTNLHAVWDTHMLEKALNDDFAGDALQLAAALLARIKVEWRNDAALWAACPAPKQPTPPAGSVGDQVALAAPNKMQLTTGKTPLHALLANDPTTNPPIGVLDKILCPESWAQGIDTVNCAGVWDQFREGEDLAGDYYHANAATVLKLVAMSGVRLAAVLEAIFNPEMRP